VSTATELIAKCASEGGFDTNSANTSQTTLLGWLNEVYQEAGEESLWFKQPRTLTPTVAGGTQYALADDVVDLAMLRVGTSLPYKRLSTEELWEAQAGIRYVYPGGYSPNFESDGDSLVEVWPASGGASVEALCAVIPTALGLSDTPKIPVGMHPALADGMIAIGLHRVYERHDAAASFDAKFEKMKQKLSRRGKSRVGSGPIQAKLYRVHF
jgi:hypothetical protein